MLGSVHAVLIWNVLMLWQELIFWSYISFPLYGFFSLLVLYSTHQMFSIKEVWFLREKAKSGKQQSDSKHTRHLELSWPIRPLNKNNQMQMGRDDIWNFTWHVNNEMFRHTCDILLSTCLSSHQVAIGAEKYQQPLQWREFIHLLNSMLYIDQMFQLNSTFK